MLNPLSQGKKEFCWLKIAENLTMCITVNAAIIQGWLLCALHFLCLNCCVLKHGTYDHPVIFSVGL